MLRWVLLRWTPVDRTGEAAGRALAGRLMASAPWQVCIDWRGVLLCVLPDPRDLAPLVLEDGYGAVFGALFDRNGRRIEALGLHEGCALAASGGRALIEDHWGGYVAVLVDRGFDLVHVVRDPTGARPVYLARLAPVHVAFSHIEDYAALGGPLTPDRDAVARFLADPMRVEVETGVAGVVALQPGERVTFARTSVERCYLWRPDLFAPRAGCDPEAAARRLRETVRACVRAWAGTGKRIALRLSGGLDSSIVLACLKRGAPEAEIVALTEHAPEAPESDERARARLVADRWRTPLLEVARPVDDVDYARALHAPLRASPAYAVLGFADRALAAAVEAAGADLVVSGQGGDHLFQRRRTPLAAADAVRLGEPWALLMHHAQATAHLSGRSVWEVARVMAVHGALRRSPARRLRPRADWEAPAPLASAHPWEEAAAGGPPAQAERIAHLLDAVRYHAPGALNTRVRCAPVLLSQPVIECCLAIPAYVMTHGGVERGLVRRAFAQDLPDEIARRVTKGETTRYFAAVVTRQLGFIRELLLDGALRRLGLLDADRLSRALARETVSEARFSDRLMVHLAAELWLRRLEAARAAQTHDHAPVETAPKQA